jgi:hypothetical protein
MAKYNQTDFVSNRAAKAAEELSRKMGLTIANEVHHQKQMQSNAFKTLRTKNLEILKTIRKRILSVPLSVRA